MFATGRCPSHLPWRLEALTSLSEIACPTGASVHKDIDDETSGAWSPEPLFGQIKPPNSQSTPPMRLNEGPKKLVMKLNEALP